MKTKKYLCAILFLLLSMCFTPAYGQDFTEPEMGEYTNHPIFHVQAQAPNILVILDNSGSMNYAAYGEWAGTDQLITSGEDGTYNDPITTIDEGEVVTYIDYAGGSAEQERSDDVPPITGSNTSINMGKFDSGDGSYVGFRFSDVNVQQGKTIDRAYIQFTSYDNESETTSLNVSAEDVNDAPAFDTRAGGGWGGPRGNNDLGERFGRKTSAQTTWEPPDWTENQKDDDTMVDVTSIVQELLDRNGWVSGNNMVFLVEHGTGGEGKRDVHSHYTGASAYSPELHIEYTPDVEDEDDFLYYGYFDRGSLDNSTGNSIYTSSRYSYNDDEDRFERDDNGDWDGNWLNWCTSRRVDVLRKVLVGGKLAGDSGDDNMTNVGENNYRGWYRDYYDSTDPNNSATGINTPYPGNYRYRVDDNWLYVDGDYYYIRVLKDPGSDDETDFNDAGTELYGLLQNVGNKARWGNMWFDNSQGGWLDQRIASGNVDNVIDVVRDKTCNTWTPLAETYHTAMEYYQQQGTSDFGSTRYTDDDEYDPYVTDDNNTIFCAKSFVILLTDGASTEDRSAHVSTNTDSDVSENSDWDDCTDLDLDNLPSGDCYRDFGNDGSDYLDDVAYYTHITDLRTDLDGIQNLSLYVVYAFDDDPKARALLKDAAINGGFKDLDNDSKPDIVGDPRGNQWGDYEDNSEWEDEVREGVPYNYWEAKDGGELKASLETAINEILKEASSGTSVSVLATRGEGEGTLTQAFFKPSLPVESSSEDILWLGYLQMLWIDSFGNVREDSDSPADKELDITADNVVRFFLDPDTGENSIIRYFPSDEHPYPCDNATCWADGDIDSLSPLWEAGKILSERDPATRTIFTHTIDNDTDISTQLYFDLDSENVTNLTDYFGVEDDAIWGAGTGAANLGNDKSNRVHNIINFVLGEPAAYQGGPSIRPRTTDDDTLWKLGDIIYSTPVTVSRPVENYGLIYDDPSYWPYYTKYAERETVVYVGANDGMLHAFTAGKYNTDDPNSIKFEAADDNGTSIVGTIGIGDEMWGFIPNSLLPHLKWLPQTEYTHVPYVDLKVRITDAKIFEDEDNTIYPGGWGTVLIGGLNFGGREIQTQNDEGDVRTFTPSIFALDVTNPRNPKVLWEKSQKTLANLGFTTNTPSIIRAGGEWMLAVASGPTDYSYDEETGALTVLSDQNARVYILDLETGDFLEDFGGSGVTYDNSYMSSPVSFDKNLNYNVDAVYMGATYDNGTINKGAIYKVTVKQTGDDFTAYAGDDDYESNPLNWNFKRLADSPAPITAPFILSIDRLNNVWLFGGTGRYQDETDKTDEAQNYLFGIKDPFFNRLKYNADNGEGGYWDYSGEIGIGAIDLNTDLFDADGYTISTDPDPDEDQVTGGGITTFTALLTEARSDAYDGWVRSLCPHAVTDDNTFAGNCSGSGPSERLLNKQAILGGIVLSPTFSPNADICGYGGYGRLWALYYETGTAWKYQVYGDQDGYEVEDTMFLGSGLTSSFGIHIGRQKGGTVFGQMSTGVIQRIDIDPAFNQKSQPSYWKDYLE